MAIYSKKREQQITFLMQASFVLAALAGWFFTKSIAGLISILLIWFGFLILIVLIRKRKIEKLLDQTGVGKVDFMDQKAFERYVMDFFKEDEFNVKPTPAIQSQGATFTMTKEDTDIAVFVHASNKIVDAHAIRQVVSACPNYPKHQVWAVTNFQYNAEAIGLALQNSITPLDREDLLEKAVLRN